MLDGFAGASLAEGYSLGTCRRHLWTATYLGEWAARRGIAIADLGDEILARFVRHREAGSVGTRRMSAIDAWRISSTVTPSW